MDLLSCRETKPDARCDTHRQRSPARWKNPAGWARAAMPLPQTGAGFEVTRKGYVNIGTGVRLEIDSVVSGPRSTSPCAWRPSRD